MTTIFLDKWSQAQTVLDAVVAATADPSGASTTYRPNPNAGGVIAFVSFSGTSTATLQLWVEDAGQWYKGDKASLNSAGGDIALMFPVFSRPGITFSLTAKSGAGAITVKVL